MNTYLPHCSLLFCIVLLLQTLFLLFFCNILIHLHCNSTYKAQSHQMDPQKINQGAKKNRDWLCVSKSLVQLPYQGQSALDSGSSQFILHRLALSPQQTKHMLKQARLQTKSKLAIRPQERHPKLHVHPSPLCSWRFSILFAGPPSFTIIISCSCLPAFPPDRLLTAVYLQLQFQPRKAAPPYTMH